MDNKGMKIIIAVAVVVLCALAGSYLSAPETFQSFKVLIPFVLAILLYVLLRQQKADGKGGSWMAYLISAGVVLNAMAVILQLYSAFNS